MGWKGTKTTIPVGMIFKKMFCDKCSTQLKKLKITNTYKRGEDGFSNHGFGGLTYVGMSEISKSYYIYKCPNCGLEISYDDQCAVARKQKNRKSVY